MTIVASSLIIISVVALSSTGLFLEGGEHDLHRDPPRALLAPAHLGSQVTIGAPAAGGGSMEPRSCLLSRA